MKQQLTRVVFACLCLFASSEAVLAQPAPKGSRPANQAEQKDEPSQRVSSIEIAAAMAIYLPAPDGLGSPVFGGPATSLAVNVSSHVALVGEAVWYLAAFGAAGPVDESAYSLMAGPRARADTTLNLPNWLGGNQTVGAFAQGLVGASRVHGQRGGFAIQPGAGLVWGAGGRRFFGEFDYVLVRGEGSGRSGPRILCGLVFSKPN